MSKHLKDIGGPPALNRDPQDTTSNLKDTKKHVLYIAVQSVATRLMTISGEPDICSQIHSATHVQHVALNLRLDSQFHILSTRQRSTTSITLSVFPFLPP
jgi:hypothetical protein